MKKILAAVAAGTLLIAGQAAATGQSVSRVGDRVGAQAEASSEIAGVPVIGILAAAGVLAAAIVVFSDDDSESD